MHGLPDSGFDRDLPSKEGELAERVDALAAWIHDLEAQVHASTAAGDAKTLKELTKALDAWSKHDPKLEERVTKTIDGLSDSVNVLTQRLETLATTVATTASGLTGREGEVAALRRRVEEDNAAVAASLAELGARVDPKPLLDLSETVRALAGEAAALKRNLQRLADRTTSKTDLLAERVEALGSSVTASASALAGREQEIAELRTAFEDWAARTDATVARFAERGNEIATLEAALAEQESALSELRTLSNGTQTHVESAVDEFRRSFNALASKVTRLDEVLEAPDTVRGLEDQIERLVRETGERDAENEAEVVALRERLDDGDARADSAIGELRQSVADLSSRLSVLDDVASGETARRLEAYVDAVRAEVESLAVRVATLATTVEEAQGRSDAKAVEIAVLGGRFDEARTRVEALVEDLREALETMPASSSPDPALVEGLNAVNGRVAELGTQLEQLETDTREYLESAASGDAEHERLVAEGIRRLMAVERDQAQGAAEISRLAEESGPELLRVGQQLEALEATQTESAQATQRVGLLLDDLTARLDAIDRERGTVAGEIARVSDLVDGESSTLRQELDTLRDAVTRSRVVPDRELAQVTERLEEVERDHAARAAEVSHMAEISASERLWVRQELEALASAQADAARAETDVVPLVDELAARVDAMRRERESAVTETARVSELVAAERTSLRSQLEALATTLTEQVSRRSDRAEALVMELAERLDTVERAGVAATSEIERVAALHSSELASVELADRLDGLTGRVASLEGSEAIGSPSSPEASDGRFRVELRSLVLRMEHAEAAAKENREAVLVELERLASRIEYRLQRLESGNSDVADQPQEVDSPLGDVVRIRSEA